jgi:hypothetical protein
MRFLTALRNNHIVHTDSLLEIGLHPLQKYTVLVSCRWAFGALIVWSCVIKKGTQTQPSKNTFSTMHIRCV